MGLLNFIIVSESKLTELKVEVFMLASHHHIKYLRFNGVNFIVSEALRKQCLGRSGAAMGILGLGETLADFVICKC